MNTLSFKKNQPSIEIKIGDYWLNDNKFLTKSQKIFVNLVFYKIKGFNIEPDIDSLYSYFNANVSGPIERKYNKSIGEYTGQESRPYPEIFDNEFN